MDDGKCRDQGRRIRWSCGCDDAEISDWHAAAHFEM